MPAGCPGPEALWRLIRRGPPTPGQLAKYFASTSILPAFCTTITSLARHEYCGPALNYFLEINCRQGHPLCPILERLKRRDDPHLPPRASRTLHSPRNAEYPRVAAERVLIASKKVARCRQGSVIRIQRCEACVVYRTSYRLSL